MIWADRNLEHKSFWTITIQWTSHDDLTEKSAETFFQFTV